MIEKVESIFSSKKIVILLFFIFVAFIYIPHISYFNIWDHNEGFYIETPREMLLNGNYIISTFNYTFRLNKPPLSYWLVIISYKIFGVSIFSERLVILFFFFSLLFLSFEFSILITKDFEKSIFVPLILSLTPRFFILAHKDLINILLTFFVVASLYFFYRFFLEKKSKYLFYFNVSLGLGFLTKGPIAILLPGFIIFVFLMVTKENGFFKVFFSPYLLFFIVPVFLYYYGLYEVTGWYFIKKFFLVENISRFTYGKFGPHRNFLYYFKVFLVDFFPWSFIFIYSLKYFKKNSGNKANIFLLLAVILPILFFSFSNNKQEYYIALVYPFASILMLNLLDEKERFLPKVFKVVIVFLIFIYNYLYFLLSYFLLTKNTIYIIILFSIIFILFCRVAFKKEVFLKYLLIILIPFYLISHNFIFFKLNDFRPAAKISERILDFGRGKNYIVLNMGDIFPSFVFYLKRRVEFLNDFEYYFLKNKLLGKEPVFAITDSRTFEKLRKDGVKFKIIERYPQIRTKGKLIAKDLVKNKYSYVYLMSNF